MSWKEFFKPTIWKIILTVILLLFVPGKKLVNPECLKEYIGAPACKYAYVLGQAFIDLIQVNDAFGVLLINYLKLILIFLIPNYVLSCLIILIINKLKRNKKPNK